MKKLALLLCLAGCSNDTTPTPQPQPQPKAALKRASDCIFFTAPAAWIEEEPSNNMRKAQFKVVDKEKKAGDAWFVISKLALQPIEPNIDRWAKQMGLESGKGVEMKGNHAFWLVDFTVAYTSDQGEETPSARMIAAILNSGSASWFFKLIGPTDTVADYKDDFIAMMKSVKDKGE